METRDNTFTTARIWVDSRVKGIGMSWYRGGHDEMTPAELQTLLDEKDACIFYDGKFYDNVSEAPLKPRRIAIETFGMPTNRSITQNPSVTVVPKGTTLEISPYLSSIRFVFPR